MAADRPGALGAKGAWHVLLVEHFPICWNPGKLENNLWPRELQTSPTMRANKVLGYIWWVEQEGGRGCMGSYATSGGGGGVVRGVLCTLGQRGWRTGRQSCVILRQRAARKWFMSELGQWSPFCSGLGNGGKGAQAAWWPQSSFK